MIFSWSQIIYILINVGLILVGVGLTALIIKLLKIEEKSSKLLFIIYIVYWIGPLVTRDYTALIQIHMDVMNNVILFIPIVAYGVIGLVYRPSSDAMALKMKSRKKVIFISLALQFACALTFFINPCFATNILQSVGAGIGASCIGLFNLMFNQQESKKKIAYVVSMLALPPLIAQFFASGFICINVSIVHATHTGVEYVDTVKYLWIIAAVMCVIASILTIFLKEKPQTWLKRNKQVTVIKSKKDKWIFVLLCVCATLVSFTKWAVGGATASVQIAYVAKKTGIDTRAYEGYASLIESIGQIIGLTVSNLWLDKDQKTKNKRIYLIIISLVIGCIYFILNGIYVNIPMFMASSSLNGLSYGIFVNILLGTIIGYIFKSKKALFTPVGVYNTALAIGIVAGTFTNCFLKQGVFNQMHGFSTYSFEDFKEANWIVNLIALGLLVIATILFIVTRLLDTRNNQHEKIILEEEFAVTSDTEM